MASDIILNIGEALVGEGNEIAHIDLMIGSKTGPVGAAFAHALSTQSEGHTNLLAVLTPNLAVKPATVLITKVTIKGMKQAVQMFGPAQYAVAKAVADCVADGTIPMADAEDLVIICGVFIHPRRRGQRQDPQVQLRGHQALHPARHEERALPGRGRRGQGHGQAPVRRPRWHGVSHFVQGVWTNARAWVRGSRGWHWWLVHQWRRPRPALVDEPPVPPTLHSKGSGPSRPDDLALGIIVHTA